MIEEINLKLKFYYDQLKKLEHKDIVLHAWSEDDTILMDLAELYYNNPQVQIYDWFKMFYQLFIWEFQSFHEGVTTYYENFYGENDYDTILKTAEYLKTNDYIDVYNIYVKGIHKYSDYHFSNYPKEWIDENKKIDIWINHNTEIIYKCMLKILLNNMSYFSK